jgi:hypothetical protein
MPIYKATGVLVAQHHVRITVEAENRTDAEVKLENLSFEVMDHLSAFPDKNIDGISVEKGDWNHDEAGDGWVILDDDDMDPLDGPAIQEVPQ